MALALTVLILIGAASVFPFLTIGAAGVRHEASILDTAFAFSGRLSVLAVAVLFFIIVIPALRLILLIYVLTPIIRDKPPAPYAKSAFRLSEALIPWSMAEIFALGCAVALVKLSDLAEVLFGPAAWMFAVLVVLVVASDPDVQVFDMDLPEGLKTARARGLVGCTRCMRPSPAGTRTCPRCGSPLRSRDPLSLQKVWAWWLVGLGCYIPANLYPMLETRTLVSSQSDTIVGGAIDLASHGNLGVAIIILIASVLIPVGKFVIVAGLAIGVRHGPQISDHRRHLLYEVVEYIGRWSMIDVFVVAILSSLVQLAGACDNHTGLGQPVFRAIGDLHDAVRAKLRQPADLGQRARHARPARDKTNHQRSAPRDRHRHTPPEPTVKPARNARSRPDLDRLGRAASGAGRGDRHRLAKLCRARPADRDRLRQCQRHRAGNTELRFRDVRVGLVEEVTFAEGLGKVLVKVRIDKNVAPYVDDDAQFWVVRPQVTTQGVSGLGTVLSGVYIEGLWDDQPGETVTRFDGLPDAPLERVGQSGLRLTMRASDGAALTENTPILYRGVQVGRVGKPVISEDGTTSEADAVIFSPHDRLIDSTRHGSGTRRAFRCRSGPAGASVNFSSIASLVSGGITFDTMLSGGTPAEPGAQFTVYAEEDAARASVFSGDDAATLTLSVLFDGNVAGLSAGAPVELNGLRIGEVEALGGMVDARTTTGDSRVRLAVTLSDPARPAWPRRRGRPRGRARLPARARCATGCARGSPRRRSSPAGSRSN